MNKLTTLQQNNQDYEWYPTTDEIIEEMKKDFNKYVILHDDNFNRNNLIYCSSYYNHDTQEKTYKVFIESMLDIGAGDGRVLDAMNVNKKYAIELASVQADDLIKRNIFLIGRDFNLVDLTCSKYGVIFCNPPYSKYSEWVCKILQTSNFDVLYLVIPIRWVNNENIKHYAKDYEVTIIGEFNFSQAEREARARVNLIRINAKWEKYEYKDGSSFYDQEKIEDAFSKWVKENIADFSILDEKETQEEKEQKELALKQTPIDILIEKYEEEKQNLADTFAALSKLSVDVIKLMGQDKKSLIEIIKNEIKRLKLKYWNIAFSQLDPVRTRMTKKTREAIFDKIREFETLDFNTENIYSIIIWIINNTNIGITEQIEDVFDRLTSKDYIKKYKSNKHWSNGDWNYKKQNSHFYEDLPNRWKLDYRIIVKVYISYWSRGYSNTQTIIDDFIVICNNLGFKIKEDCKPNYSLHSKIQEFYTVSGILAFTMRYYTGNGNAHLKINKKILTKFNVEVAKLRHWIHSAEEVKEEFDVTEEQAANLWNTGIQMLAQKDIKLIGRC